MQRLGLLVGDIENASPAAEEIFVAEVSQTRNAGRNSDKRRARPSNPCVYYAASKTFSRFACIYMDNSGADTTNPREFFKELVALEQPIPVLEIGTLQSRPGFSTHHFDFFPYLDRQDFVMSDIAPGPDVDEVADIHNLPSEWGGRFGATLSNSVFEHLERPWIAAAQLFRVLRPGGLCYTCTHQSFPLHGFPSDYFRFSDKALSLIFEDAGFEILSVGYEHRAKIIIPEYLLRFYFGDGYDAAALSDLWNEQNPSYVLVHLLARRPELS